MNVNIHVHDALQLEVQGHADMRGAFISAKSLDAFFESLILESLQDIVESKSWSANLGLSLESVSNLKGVNTLVSTLSGGEKARLSLAQIAAKTPKLLILDEITNNLDLETKEHVIQVLKYYPGAIIVIFHEADFLEEIGISEVVNVQKFT